MRKRVLVVGGGGREYAMVRALNASDRVGRIACIAPGISNYDGFDKAYRETDPLLDANGLFALKDRAFDLVIIGPEAPLEQGVVDALRKDGVRVFGPTKSAARLETSKIFGKVMMREAEIPTSPFEACKGVSAAHATINGWPSFPIVVKFSGLAGGKGVKICANASEAHEAVDALCAQTKSDPNAAEFVLEQFLEGPELSVHALCNGLDYVLLPIAQDHKTLTEDPSSLMTGGMGAIAPVPWVTRAQIDEIRVRIIKPLLTEMVARDTPFTGCLFIGLKMTKRGPMVLEFNVRFGDPETQVILPLLNMDFYDLISACVDRKFYDLPSPLVKPDAYCACVVLAAPGYPDAATVGQLIVEGTAERHGTFVHVVHHATARTGKDLRTAGGRVLSIVAGPTGSLMMSLGMAYGEIRNGRVSFEGMQYRGDIGASCLIAPQDS